jgi:hypothetical protein
MAKKRVFADKKYYTAVYCGRKFTGTTTEWGNLLDCNVAWLSRRLRMHYSMQAVLDEEFAKQQQQQQLYRTFVFGGANHA